VENRPGASGAVGSEAVSRSTPDGYTFSFASPSAYAAAPYVYTNLAYDPTKDLLPVSVVGRTPYAFAVSPDLGVNDVLGLVALAKSKPGQLNYSSIGEGSIAHLGMVVFAEKMGLEPTAFLDVLRNSAAYSQVMDTKGPLMARREFQKPVSRVDQSYKDFSLMLEYSAALGQQLPFAQVYAELLHDCIEQGESQWDNAAILAAIARRGGD